MEKFTLPEKWCCLANNTEEDRVLTDYIKAEYGATCDYDVSCKANCWFSNIELRPRFHYDFRNDPPPNCVEITFEQFIKYVLNGHIDISKELIKQDPELAAILTKLLSV